jgi:hypothetical protein
VESWFKKRKPRDGKQLSRTEKASTISPPGRIGLASSLNLPGSNYGAEKRPSTASRKRVLTAGEIDNATGRTQEDNSEEEEREPRGSRDPLNAHARPSRLGGSRAPDSSYIVHARVATFSSKPPRPRRSRRSCRRWTFGSSYTTALAAMGRSIGWTMGSG